MLEGEQLAGAAETGLDLVHHQQRPVGGGDLAQATEVARGRDDDAGLALDRLDQNRGDVGVHRLLDRVGVAVGQHAEAGGEGAEALLVEALGGKADDGGGAAVEVAVEDQDLGLVVGHALDVVAPLAGGLDRGFDRLGAAVHGQHAGEAGELGDLLTQGAELIVAEGARGQGHAARLLDERLDQAGVAVTLVDRRVGGKAVHVAAPLDVPDPHSGGPRDHHVEGVVVVGTVAILEVDVVGGLHGVPPPLGRGWSVGSTRAGGPRRRGNGTPSPRPVQESYPPSPLRCWQDSAAAQSEVGGGGLSPQTESTVTGRAMLPGRRLG